MSSIRALVATGDGPAEFQSLDEASLPDGDVTVDVAYSSVNYKDGLAVTGRGKIARQFPMVCGIDLAGRVVSSGAGSSGAASSGAAAWAPGDEVVVTGWGLSEIHPGGYTERQRLSSGWLVRLPPALSLEQSMAVGTAGFTAMLSVMALEEAGVVPGAGAPGAGGAGGEVLVTGAAGGVGSIAVALLAQLGYSVVASTGRPETWEYLRGLGASSFIDRSELAVSGRPLESERWAGVVDTVGSTTLATALSQVRRGGAVAACGLAGGNDLPATVLPFILRGVSLLGIDSVMCPLERRVAAWQRLARDLSAERLSAVSHVHPFSEVPALASAVLAGEIRGRAVVEIGGPS